LETAWPADPEAAVRKRAARGSSAQTQDNARGGASSFVSSSLPFDPDHCLLPQSCAHAQKTVVRHQVDRRPLRAHRRRSSATGSPPTAAPAPAAKAVFGGGRPLPSLRLARLPLGAPHADLPQAEGPGRSGLRLVVSHFMARTAGPSTPKPARPATSPRRGLPARGLSEGRSRTTPAGSPCRFCGTKSARPSSPTNPPRSSACSTRPLTA
jgi:hypothetical protein